MGNWGIMQERVYKTKDVEELRQRIVYKWEHLDQHIINTAIRQWHKRLQVCVAAKGQFEHAPWQFVNINHYTFVFVFYDCCVKTLRGWEPWLNVVIKFLFSKNICCIVKNLWHLHNKYRLKNDCSNFDLYWCRFGRETAKRLFFYGPSTMMCSFRNKESSMSHNFVYHGINS